MPIGPDTDRQGAARSERDPNKPHTSLDMPYTAPGPYGVEGTIGDALAQYAIATEYKGEEWRETKGAGLGGTTTYETPAFWANRKDMLEELDFELGTPED